MVYKCDYRFLLVECLLHMYIYTWWSNFYVSVSISESKFYSILFTDAVAHSEESTSVYHAHSLFNTGIRVVEFASGFVMHHTSYRLNSIKLTHSQTMLVFTAAVKFKPDFNFCQSYPGGWKLHFIPSISEILPQKCYHCDQYIRRHLMNLISHCYLSFCQTLLIWACYLFLRCAVQTSSRINSMLK